MRLERGEASLYIAGVADPWSPWHNLDLALLGIPGGACTVLLAHVPDYLDTDSAGRVDLQLSGHNHGGQIKIPGLGALLVSSRYGRRYDEGFFTRRGTIMYVSRGLGGKPPVRFGSLPEITRFVLRPA
jgi:predicted MPP superfamily phosphohydrolase